MQPLLHFNLNLILVKTITGELDVELLKTRVREIADIARKFPHHNILIDTRQATTPFSTLPITDTTIVRDVLVEVADHFQGVTCKMATLLPRGEGLPRNKHALDLEKGMVGMGLNHKVFWSYEEAIQWLGEISPVPEDNA